eukprot:TRINITY_DN6313_c0_g1_i1.p1 TRINITY_DN6313_c0_g1~~TRINITY_DN6313_c0_g1_i1.p1  ORF type:complete len:602 (-),score=123.10 TRINITY_DN6313_c0_g1_i1:32-1837(-)
MEITFDMNASDDEEMIDSKVSLTPSDIKRIFDSLTIFPPTRECTIRGCRLCAAAAKGLQPAYIAATVVQPSKRAAAAATALDNLIKTSAEHVFHVAEICEFMYSHWDILQLDKRFCPDTRDGWFALVRDVMQLFPQVFKPQSPDGYYTLAVPFDPFRVEDIPKLPQAVSKSPSLSSISTTATEQMEQPRSSSPKISAMSRLKETSTVGKTTATNAPVRTPSSAAINTAPVKSETPKSPPKVEECKLKMCPCAAGTPSILTSQMGDDQRWNLTIATAFYSLMLSNDSAKFFPLETLFNFLRSHRKYLNLAALHIKPKGGRSDVINTLLDNKYGLFEQKRLQKDNFGLRAPFNPYSFEMAKLKSAAKKRPLSESDSDSSSNSDSSSDSDSDSGSESEPKKPREQSRKRQKKQYRATTFEEATLIKAFMEKMGSEGKRFRGSAEVLKFIEECLPGWDFARLEQYHNNNKNKGFKNKRAENRRPAKMSANVLPKLSVVDKRLPALITPEKPKLVVPAVKKEILPPLLETTRADQDLQKVFQFLKARRLDGLFDDLVHIVGVVDMERMEMLDDECLEVLEEKKPLRPMDKKMLKKAVEQLKEQHAK